ncbi:uncharacterized protein EV422DRAFT_262871 [Fimicolochytrium jonesii]|uniref:uncharacterized protein n=1 Tax=Fimicolochytrium jonesii TaxID=1396493 RepID=UPI0022FE14AE|nr:uncharacterized protein EV422DRAFT_262871 [Fimicolochytrium jonesii]KAI8817047.1 hypothetical protein EV422DRAFT_262871 [Fimicolochytrium jonesii]
MSEPVNVLWGEEASLSSALDDALFTPTIGAETSAKHHHHHHKHHHGGHHKHDQQKQNERGNNDTHHHHHHHNKPDKGGKRRSGEALPTVDVPISSIPAYPSPPPVITVNNTHSHFAVTGGSGGETEDSAWHVYAVRPFRHLFSRKCPEIPSLESEGGVDGGEGITRRRPARLRRVCLLEETNVAVVQLGDHRVAVWDDKEGRFVWEVQCRECVRNVGVTRDCVIIVLTNKIVVYTLTPPPTKLHTFQTCPNPDGIFALSPAPQLSPQSHSLANTTLAFPARHPGQAHHTTLHPTTARTSIIPAHSTPISCLALSPSGSLLATASEKGTLIRVFRVPGEPETQHTPLLLHELRRGVDQARIWTIAFSARETAVCVASDKQTVHVFQLTAGSTSDQQQHEMEYTPTHPTTTKPMQMPIKVTFPHHRTNESSPSTSTGGSWKTAQSASPPHPAQTHIHTHGHHADASSKRQQATSTSLLAPLSPYLPKYFSEHRSFAQFHLPGDTTNCCVVAGFVEPKSSPGDGTTTADHHNDHHDHHHRRETVAVVSDNGTLSLFSYDVAKGGLARREGFWRFWKRGATHSNGGGEGGTGAMGAMYPQRVDSAGGGQRNPEGHHPARNETPAIHTPGEHSHSHSHSARPSASAPPTPSTSAPSRPTTTTKITPAHRLAHPHPAQPHQTPPIPYPADSSSSDSDDDFDLYAEVAVEAAAAKRGHGGAGAGGSGSGGGASAGGTAAGWEDLDGDF